MNARRRARRLWPPSLPFVLDMVGAVTGVAGLVLVLVGDLSSTQRAHLAYFLAVLIAGVLIVGIVARVIMGKRPARLVGREEMLATGRRLLNHEICHSAVLFAGDASWAPDYKDDIGKAVGNGKKITVVYPASKRAAAADNLKILEQTNATLIETPQDTGLRAMLLDHASAAETLLFMVRRNRDSATVQVGGGDGKTPPYSAKIYDWKEDELLISLVTKMFALVSDEEHT